MARPRFFCGYSLFSWTHTLFAWDSCGTLPSSETAAGVPRDSLGPQGLPIVRLSNCQNKAQDSVSRHSGRRTSYSILSFSMATHSWGAVCSRGSNTSEICVESCTNWHCLTCLLRYSACQEWKRLFRDGSSACPKL